MYKEIDELLEVLKQDQSFRDLKNAQEALYDEKTMALLSRYQQLQEDYMRFRKYRDCTDLKNELHSINQDITNYKQIQEYYRSYYAFNELLDEVSHIIFDGVSDEIIIGAIKL